MARGITVYLAKMNTPVQSEKEFQENYLGEITNNDYVYNFDSQNKELFIRDNKNTKTGYTYQLLYTNSFTSVLMNITNLLYIFPNDYENDTVKLSLSDALGIEQAINYCIDYHKKDKNNKIKNLLNNKFISDIEQFCIYDDGYKYEWKCFAQTLRLCADFIQTNEIDECNDYAIYINAWG